MSKSIQTQVGHTSVKLQMLLKPVKSIHIPDTKDIDYQAVVLIKG